VIGTLQPSGASTERYDRATYRPRSGVTGALSLSTNASTRARRNNVDAPAAALGVPLAAHIPRGRVGAPGGINLVRAVAPVSDGFRWGRRAAEEQADMTYLAHGGLCLAGAHSGRALIPYLYLSNIIPHRVCRRPYLTNYLESPPATLSEGEGDWPRIISSATSPATGTSEHCKRPLSRILPLAQRLALLNSALFSQLSHLAP